MSQVYARDPTADRAYLKRYPLKTGQEVKGTI